jgi:hypothetical protein
MKFINSWKSKVKQNDKFICKLRIGKLSIFELIGDTSSKRLRIVLFNFGLESK